MLGYVVRAVTSRECLHDTAGEKNMQDTIGGWEA